MSGPGRRRRAQGKRKANAEGGARRARPLFAPLAAAAVLLTAACAGSARGLPIHLAGTPPSCCPADEVSVRYLGVGGWLIRAGGDALLTAPFYSNPGLLKTGLWFIGADTARIDALLPPVDDVSAILVGHSHYDHLMDVPYVARAHARDAVVYGNRTMVNLLAGAEGLTGRTEAVDSLAGSDATDGRWTVLPGGRIRFMPLSSGHAPHFLGIELMEGVRTRPLRSLPRSASGWVGGEETYAFLIDVLDEAGRTLFRIHYADAASEPPRGFLPPGEDGKPVDVAILCPASYAEVDRYPRGILQELLPRNVLLGHWENFFNRPVGPPEETVPATDLRAFLDTLRIVLPDSVPRVLPEPGAVFLYRPPGS